MSSVRRFMQRYRSLTVLLDDGRQVGVDVHQYMINRDASAHNCRVALAAWAEVSRHITAEVEAANRAERAAARAAAGRHPPVQRVRHTRDEYVQAVDPAVTFRLLGQVPYGKGAPAAVAAFLRLAVRFGETTAEELQDWCDERHVGLDCSGFVSNYLVHRGLMRATDVGNTAARSYDVAADRRRALDEVRYLDLMVWEDGGHVAIIDSDLTAHEVPAARPRGQRPGAAAPPATRTESTCVVVESNGGRGLAAETYVLESVNAARVFTVRRENGSRHRVYVVNRNIPAETPSLGPGLWRMIQRGEAALA